MKKKQVIWLTAVIVVVLIGIGAYSGFNRYLGNNVEIESVMAQGEETATSEGAGEASASTGEAVSSDKLNGTWSIASGSKVYWSVTTSKETVNFVDEAVTGSWKVDLNDAASMAGEGVVDLTALDSGNSMRDSHVKERDDLLTVTKYPQATFKTKSISSVPAEWNEGAAVPLTISGTLTIKGVDKEVTFDSSAMYKNEQLLLSGKTNVTFADFGMANPHTVVLETENNFTVQLELVLNKG
ncbi:YceI-like domain-containing protein [Paenibacillus catalpae]|uniref:YceI-like domain-containing protein n=2 Tax=Paenibacillus catalpae TaxID=1045775 RepID=A0A1I2GG12_9BACL|nr:YceI family protein [Paenibacillus catalpae]SFF16764.1 YceI-like domain-containing protein [Paenibacillus catalpae]